MAYVTLAELRSHMQLTPGVFDVDPQLESALTVAEYAVDDHCGRRFTQDALPVTARRYQVCGWSSFHCDDISTTTGLVVETASEYGAASWTTLTDVYPTPVNAAAQRRTAWPYTGLTSPDGNFGEWVRVTARWGWPAVPEEVKRATLLLAHRLYRRHASPNGIEGIGDFGPVRVTSRDADVTALLAPLRRVDRVLGVA